MFLLSADDHSLETVLNVLLIRFGIVVALVGMAAVVVFALALRLKRRGRLDAARRRYGAPAARAMRGYSRRRGGLTRAALDEAARRLEDRR
ncbi:hypothetical protein P0W64_00445 [Tsukamurella sp. 8F]|uniref:hypothetical protein n=1 Tax=unclassified Tsukamurella TaxID=2633480 RepID=UPI0023B9E147|nr:MULTISPECIES: hypothetical protein [unclassified Tsukamurella]MDF0531293.1 hypothetical protein [Tsukamurella sp. 8J]MDF0585242.1 hypothetical protein [Tsukamurella sp. 8F]